MSAKAWHGEKTEIVFIKPPLSPQSRDMEFAAASNNMPPQGLCSLGAVAEKEGWTAKIIVGSALDLSNNELAELILSFKPRYVCLSALTMEVNNASKIAQYVKTFNKNITVIIGGTHITAAPHKTMLTFKCFDIGVIGEGEKTLIELLHALEDRQDLEGVDGIIFRKKGELCMTKKRELIAELDSLPFPAFHLLHPSFPSGFRPAVNIYKKLPAAALTCSRGCFGRCVFCDKSVFGSRVRSHSPGYIVKLMNFCYREYGVMDFVFYDDSFMQMKARVKQLCRLLIKNSVKFRWVCTARIDSVDREVLLLLKRAGCWQVGYGIESGDQAILNFLQKGITLNQIKKALKLTRETGLFSRGFFMIANPGETKKSLWNTMNFALCLKLDEIQLSLFTPFPGTEFSSRAEEYGIFFPDWRYLSLSHLVFIPDELTEEDIFKYRKKIYQRFYFRFSVIWRHLKEIIKTPAYALNLIIGFFSVARVVFGNYFVKFHRTRQQL